MILNDILPNLLFTLTKKYLEKKLKNLWLPQFYSSEFSTKSQQSTQTHVHDVVDDVLYIKNKYPKTKELSVRFILIQYIF
jgi:hypothetical protein